MIPTPRLLMLGLAAVIPFGVSEALPGLGMLTPGLLGVLAVVTAIDWSLTARQIRLTVWRELAGRLSIGTENPVRVVVNNRSARGVQLRVRDEVPPVFGVSELLMSGSVKPGGEVTLRYTVTPPHRGDFEFGRTVVRWRSVFGLLELQRAFPTEQAVKVYPNLRDLRRYDLLVRRGLLQEAGTRVARRLGPGSEFERLREYVPDDEFRRINWKATARRGAPISAEYETERSQNVMVLLDAGRLMAAVADNLTKLDHSMNAGLLLAYAGSLRGDRVGLLAYSDQVAAFLPPRRGRRAFLSILEQLYRLEPELTESDHARAFSYLATRNISRSLLVLFTDLADPEPSRALTAHLARAASRHLVALVTVSDPALVNPAQRPAKDSQQLYEKAVAQRLLDERRQVSANLSYHGILTLDRPADRLSAEVVAMYLELKSRSRL